MSTPNYTAAWLQDHDCKVVSLTDKQNGVEVKIIPTAGNRAYQMSVRGENILHFPAADPGVIAGSKHLDGIPFLAPWANRMPEGFYADGKKYRFDMEAPFLRLDPNGIPIHGLLTACPWWKVTTLVADADAATVTSKLEFWRYPDLMRSWPVAHEYEMTYRLAGGALEVRLAITNLSADEMPVAVGFHPYFELPGVPRDQAAAYVPVRSHVETDARLLPTGETKPVSFADAVSLSDHLFDDGFIDLVRGASGQAVFAVEGGGKKIRVAFGPKYTVAIVYAPKGQNYICFEPMTAITNGVNLHHEGKYDGLQTIAPGGRWEESFWIQSML